MGPVAPLVACLARLPLQARCPSGVPADGPAWFVPRLGSPAPLLVPLLSPSFPSDAEFGPLAPRNNILIGSACRRSVYAVWEWPSSFLLPLVGLLVRFQPSPLHDMVCLRPAHLRHSS